MPALRELELWNRALGRIGAALIEPEAEIAVTAVTASSPPDVAAVQTYAAGDLVLLYDLTGGDEYTGRVFEITSVTGTTFELYREDGSTFTAATAGFVRRLPDTKVVRSLYQAWPRVRDEVLAAHAWKSVERRAKLARLDSARTITGITQASPAVVTTAAAHGLIQGDEVLIDGIVGMVELNGRWLTVGSMPTTTTFQLAGEDSTAYTAWSSGGTVRKALAPLRAVHTYDYRYDLPSTPADFCLAVHSIEEMSQGDEELEWIVEDRQLLTDVGITCEVRYSRRVWNVDRWDPLLVSAAAARLAFELVPEIIDSPNDRQQLWQAYGELLGQGRRRDRRQRSPARFKPTSWELRRWNAR